MIRLFHGIAIAGALLFVPTAATAQTPTRNAKIVSRPRPIPVVCARSSCGVGYVTICRWMGRVIKIDASHCR